MEKVPYNLYINYEELSSLFEKSNSRQENMIRCGVASIEITTALLGSFIEENDPLAQEKITDLVRGLETQFTLLSKYAEAYPGGNYQERMSANIENLRLLSPEFTDDVDNITRQYFHLVKKVNVGLGTQMNEIRAHFDLPRIIAGLGTVSRRHGFMGKEGLEELSKLNYYNTEDETFMRTHQISEYWFNIAIRELNEIAAYFQSGDTRSKDIIRHFKATYEILVFLSDHIMILENMVLADYHPLRVALRGASGGQSKQAHEIFGVARKVYGMFLMLLERENKTILHILENPRTETELHAIVNNFSKLERGLKGFFFEHYNLSSGTIGSKSFGSIGYDLVTLTNKFVQPLFQEIDDAKYDFTMKTNFQYGDTSGQLIHKVESFEPDFTEYGTTKDIALIEEVIQKYFTTISDLNMENWVGLFAEDGYIEDPVGSRPYVGHQQLSVFFKGVQRFFSEIDMIIEEKTIIEDGAEVKWKAQATAYNGKEISFHGKEVFQIGAKGEICSAHVYWGPSMIAEQLN